QGIRSFRSPALWQRAVEGSYYACDAATYPERGTGTLQNSWVLLLWPALSRQPGRLCRGGWGRPFLFCRTAQSVAAYDGGCTCHWPAAYFSVKLCVITDRLSADFIRDPASKPASGP